METQEQLLQAAIKAFPFKGEVLGVKSFGTGHINDTYRVKTAFGGPGYILQRINTAVFTKPEELMENAFGVTEYISRMLEQTGGDVRHGVQSFLRTHDGAPLFYDEEGLPWRSYAFIEDSYGYDQSPTLELFREAGLAFGRFLWMLRDYPADTLHETIPDFHNTPARFAALEAAVAQNAMGRLEGCRAEVDFALARRADCSLLTDMQAAGKLPLRVTHNDTKLNNILFDEATGKALCVIDLDTIMPGIVGNDFGDAIRYGASTAAEDEEDLARVKLDLEMFRVFAEGYLEGTAGALTETETATLAQSARLLTLECGMRFLADHLGGDTYFKVSRPDHNLHRCRTQFELVRQMEQQMDVMEELVRAAARQTPA